MQQRRIELSRNDAYCLLQQCATQKDLECSMQVQSLIIQDGLDSIVVLSDHLIRLYASCGCFVDANRTFNKADKPSVHTWSAIISAHVNHGHPGISIELYQKMHLSGIKGNKHVYIPVLKACILNADLDQGRKIHKHIVHSGFEIDGYVGSALVDMYCKCGSLKEARETYDTLPNRNVVACNAMIAGYARCGKLEEAHILFSKIKDRDVVSWNSLIAGYCKYGNLVEARKLFEEMPSRDVLSWGTMIGGYAEYDEGHLALQSYQNMQSSGLKPDRPTFLAVLKACGSLGAVEQGRCIHKQIVKYGLKSDVFIGSSLVDMYAKCGLLGEARNIFDELPHPNIVSWNAIIAGYAKCGNMGEAQSLFEKSPNRDVVSWGAMIAGYAQQGKGFLALECFYNMQQEGIIPDKITYLSTFKACGSVGGWEHARHIHNQFIESRLELDVNLGNAIIDMYAKCGDLKASCEAFEKLPNQNIVSWNIMIAAYAQHGQHILAQKCFKDMQHNGINPGRVTILNILKACGSASALEQGRSIHKQIIDMGLELDVAVGSSLVDLYCKCGSLGDARQAFDRFLNRDVIMWNAMIAGYSQYGYAGLVIECFEEMQQSGMQPDDVTFVAILNACNNAGLIDEALWHLRSMSSCHGIMPSVLHFSCAVDLLGRAACFVMAKDLLAGHFQPDVTIWTALLNSCKMHGNVELGWQCFSEIVHLDSSCDAGYILMSNIYANAHMIENAAKVIKMRESASVRKKRRTHIEINKKVHEFEVGIEMYPQVDDVHAMLRKLREELKKEGYSPQIPMLPSQMSNEDKEDASCGHSERLAIAFALLNTPPGTVIRATKKLQMCCDCHEVIKLISKCVHREIILRCAYCIHQFKDGICSCKGISSET